MLPEPRGTVGVVFGGANSEHEVSVRSARGVGGALAANGWRVRLLGIDRGGAWHEVESVDDFEGLSAAASAARRPPGPRDGQLDGLDVVFPVLHGVRGEDGTVQGLLELAGLPYVGCGVLASALAMDKRMASRMLAAEGIPVIDTRSVTSFDELDEVVGGMPLPLFIKPNRSGSSVGVSWVDALDELLPAVRGAMLEDSTVLIQPAQRGTEVSIGVLEQPGGALAVTGASVLRLPASATHFSYKGKYGTARDDDHARLEIPAELPAELLASLQGAARAVFDTLGCAGLARVDFFVDPHGDIVVNEVNTMPGFAEQSHFPRLWAAAGVGYRDLVDRLVEGAMARVALSVR